MTAVTKKVGYLQLTFLIYGAVCGGAFGLEGMVGSSGPGISLVLLMVMPFLFSVPVSLAVSELTGAFPVEGGNYRWSRMAFGDFWGFQAGWWSWASAVATSGTFVALFTGYIQSTWWPGMSGIVRWLLCLAMIWGVHYINVRGIDVVGNASVVMSFLLLVPFVLMIVIGLTHWHVNPFVPFAPGHGLLRFGTALATAFWLYSGYEKLSTAAEEVENPQKTFPPALFSAATLAMLSYFLPTLAALAMLGNYSAWGTDPGQADFTVIGGMMGGEALRLGTVVAGLISNALLLNVTMLAASRSLVTMAEDGLMPKQLSAHSPRYGTPTAALLVGSMLLSLLALFSFSQLVIIYAWFTMAAMVLIYLNVWKLRRVQPEAPRPFTVPGGTLGVFVLAVPTLFLSLLGAASYVMPDWHLNGFQLGVAFVAMLSGAITYPLLRR
ncbi:MAG: APC family permease [Candidatus Xenobia bacterium]